MFAARFRVPPITVPDWRLLLKRYLIQALPAHQDDSENDLVCHLFDEHRSATTPVEITPREVKTFVNEIGVLHRQWQDDIPVSHLAYYALLGNTAESRAVAVRALVSHEKPIPRMLESSVFENLEVLCYSQRNRDLSARAQLERCLATGPHMVFGGLVPKEDARERERFFSDLVAIVEKAAPDILPRYAGVILPHWSIIPQSHKEVIGKIFEEGLKTLATLEFDAVPIFGARKLLEHFPESKPLLAKALHKNATGLLSSGSERVVPNLIELLKLLPEGKVNLSELHISRVAPVCNRIVESAPTGSKWTKFLLPDIDFEHLINESAPEKRPEVIAVLLVAAAQSKESSNQVLTVLARQLATQGDGPQRLLWLTCVWAIRQQGSAEALELLKRHGQGLTVSGSEEEQALISAIHATLGHGPIAEAVAGSYAFTDLLRRYARSIVWLIPALPESAVEGLLKNLSSRARHLVDGLTTPLVELNLLQGKGIQQWNILKRILESERRPPSARS